MMSETASGPSPNEPLRVRILRALVRVAPDIDPVTIDLARSIREQYDFDSVDLMNFALALKQDIGLEIPDADLTRLATIAGGEAYLASRLARSGAPRSPTEPP